MAFPIKWLLRLRQEDRPLAVCAAQDIPLLAVTREGMPKPTYANVGIAFPFTRKSPVFASSLGNSACDIRLRRSRCRHLSVDFYSFVAARVFVVLAEPAARRLPLVLAMLQRFEYLPAGQPCIASWQLCNHCLFEGATKRKR